MAKKTITVQGAEINIVDEHDNDYICITDMVKGFEDGRSLIDQWLRNKDTILFLGVWERLNNPDFRQDKFQEINQEAGRNSFALSAKRWIETTGAIGIISKPGRYGGTYAHKDIAFEFGSWLSPEFKLYLIKEFQRLKDLENVRQSLEWDLKRTVAKLNYRIQTDAVKEKLIGSAKGAQASIIYASEADVINMALYGLTAKEWRETYEASLGNMREYSSVEQLLVLSNLEGLNAEFIRQGMDQQERLERLKEIAQQQMTSLRSLASARSLKKLKE